MSNAKVTGLRSIELGVTDLNRSAAFYSHIWGLEPVVSDADTIHLRGNGSEHHVVTLRERPKTAMIGVHFAANDKTAVDELHAKACDVAGHPNVVNDRSKPLKLSHVVLNSAKIDEQTAFFIDLLGFRLSDSTDMMDFIRCCADHHSIALARGEGPSLNHMAYEVASIDGLMRGAGRMKQNGFNIEWGVGRHGPGDNVFSYFVEPNGFVVEYTSEIEQVDESTFTFHDATYWRNFPMRPCRWGMAGHPSNRLRAAMGGDISVADERDGKRCEEIMAQKLGR